MRRIFFHRFADAVDVHRHGRRISHGFHTPETCVERFPAEYAVRVDHEKFQQLEFFFRQQLFLSPHGDDMRRRIQDDIPDNDAVVFFLPLQPFILGELRLDARHEDARRKRFFNVFVRAEPKAADLVDIAAPGRHHHDGRVDLPADTAADLKSVHARQHDIEQDQVIIAGERQAHAFVSFIGQIDRKSRQMKIVFFDARDLLIVFNDQYSFHGLPPFPDLPPLPATP